MKLFFLALATVVLSLVGCYNNAHPTVVTPVDIGVPPPTVTDDVLPSPVSPSTAKPCTCKDQLDALNARLTALEATVIGLDDPSESATLRSIATSIEVVVSKLDEVLVRLDDQPHVDESVWREIAAMILDGTIPSTDELLKFVDAEQLPGASRLDPIRGLSVLFTDEQRPAWSSWVLGQGPLPLPRPKPKGKRHVVVVYETADSTAAFGRLRGELRTGPVAEYLRDKGHLLTLTDDDKGASTVADQLRKDIDTVELPAIFILDAATQSVLFKDTLPDTATADSVLETLKAHGG